MAAVGACVAAKRIRVRLFCTPYSVADPQRPYIRSERNLFLNSLSAHGVSVASSDYFADDEGSLQRHFGVLYAIPTDFES